MVVERINEILGAKPVDAGGALSSGAYVICGDSATDVTVAEGATAQLLIADAPGAIEINIDVERGANLSVVHLVTEHSSTNISIAVAEGGVCRMTQAVISSSDSRVVASLVGSGARFELGGVFVITDEDQTSVTVDVNHMVADTVSRTMVKGVASGNAHGSFSGLVYVAPDAQHTDSVQSSRNVTIGTARIETLPQLEIYADDVKCSHGATVGQMDADAILYMRQRGLSLVDAKRLQIEGFVDDVVLHASVEGITDALTELLGEKLTRL